MTTPADNRASDYRKIHGLARLLGMDDEAYRTMLKDRYGVTSSKELSPQSRAALIRSLSVQLASNARNFADLSNRTREKATPSQLRAIEAMWANVSRARTAEGRKKSLNTFCEKLTGVSCITWICKADARTLIRAISAMGANTPEQFNKKLNKPKSKR